MSDGYVLKEIRTGVPELDDAVRTLIFTFSQGEGEEALTKFQLLLQNLVGRAKTGEAEAVASLEIVVKMAKLIQFGFHCEWGRPDSPMAHHYQSRKKCWADMKGMDNFLRQCQADARTPRDNKGFEDFFLVDIDKLKAKYGFASGT